MVQVLEESGCDQDVEEQADEHDEQRRLDRQSPERLAVGMEQGDAVRLDQRPGGSGERGQRAEHRDCARTRRPVLQPFEVEIAGEFCMHDVLPSSRFAGPRPADVVPAG